MTLYIKLIVDIVQTKRSSGQNVHGITQNIDTKACSTKCKLTMCSTTADVQQEATAKACSNCPL
jgi:hypothetical protein